MQRAAPSPGAAPAAARRPLVMGDQKRLVQVFANMLSNAAKYTHEGGQHRARGPTCATAHVHVDVADNGIGMSPDLAAHAFDLFAQAERTLGPLGGRAGPGPGAGEEPGRTASAARSPAHSDGPGHGQHLHGLPAAPGSDGGAPRRRAARRARRRRPRAPAHPGGGRQRRRGRRCWRCCSKRRATRCAVEHARARGAGARRARAARRLPARHRPARHGRQRTGPAPARAARNGAARCWSRSPATARTGPPAHAAAGFDHHLVKPVDTQELFGILARV